ncbi:hypothetical protein [Bacillus sp. UNCCL13]|nr:hypothetical protein [Bacillus sp. UNCCL13]
MKLDDGFKLGRRRKMQILLIRHGESEDDFLEENYSGSLICP